MARKDSMSELQDADANLDISSLIDVSFLLLIYFLVTSSLQLKEADLQIAIPSNATGSSISAEPLKIELLKDNSIKVNETVYGQNIEDRELNNLFERLKLQKESAEIAGNDASVFIIAADEAKQQRFIDIINCLSKAGIEKISLSGFTKE